MGFYAPAQIVRDAREHGVSVRAIDVQRSGWDCTLEAGQLRLGLRLMTGFQAAWAAEIEKHRSFISSFAALVALRLPRLAMQALADADALRSLGLDRRAALWQVRGLDDRASLPLLAHEKPRPHQAQLPFMSPAEAVIADYQTTQLSLKAHPASFLRASLAAEGVVSCAAAMQARDGAAVRVAGIVLVRQRPGSAKGVIFATIEDETGIANIVIWASLQEKFRRAIVGASLLLVDGKLQRSPEGIVHVVAAALHDRTPSLRGLSADPCEPRPVRCDEIKRGPAMHPRDERAIPRSRGFSLSKGAGSKGAGSKGAGSKGAGSKGAGSKGAGSRGAGIRRGHYAKSRRNSS